MRIIIKKATPKEPEGEREGLLRVTTGTLSWTPDGWEVDGDVNLYGQGLKKIPYRFHRVGGDMKISDNFLISLEGSPRTVGGDFWANSNHLTSLIGGPEEVGGQYNVGMNNLSDLTGSPNSVGESFMAYNNSLVSIRGISRKIGEPSNCKTTKFWPLSKIFPKWVEIWFCGTPQFPGGWGGFRICGGECGDETMRGVGNNLTPLDDDNLNMKKR